MELHYFDAHCHPYTREFDADRADVLARMEREGVGGIVVGTDLPESKQAIELAEQYDFLWAAVGLHPNDNLEEAFGVEAYEALTKHPKVVAIGECGLDYYRRAPSAEEKTRQYARLRPQIELAKKVGKPLIIHCRPTQGTQNAHEEMLELLQEHGNPPAVIHFFTSTAEIAEKYFSLGCYISFPGPITYTDMYDESIRATPLDKILSETDSPFAAPVPHRGQRNEPSYVLDVVAKIAAVKNLPVEEMSRQIILNSQRVFGL